MTGLDRLAAALSDRYRIERELGAGGMATVYLAEDLKHDRRVAIKVLKPELAAVLGAERFVQEIKTTAALSHPHILPLFDSGEAGGFLYYVMPYLQGETIREKLNRETQLGVEEAVKIATEVAEALDYAHQHGIIHRDIKPENVLLHAGRPMVMDFGIALAVSAAAGGRMTETGLSLGTPHYMSPEQATADKDLTARSDVYSLGSVLYEMLAGDPPHTASSAQAIIMKIVTEEPAPVTDRRKSVPPNIAAAVARALEKLPADRFESARAFVVALHDPSYGGARAATIVPASGRQRATMAALALGLVAVGGILGRALAPKATSSDQVVRLQVPPPAGTRFDAFTAQMMAVSPDGERLALSAVDNRGGGRRLYLHRLDRLEATPIEGTEQGAAPFFSPDGRSLGFISLTDGRLRRADLGGGPVTTVSDQAASPGFAPVWADDGTIYFTGADFRLYRVSASGGEARRLGDTGAPLSEKGGLPSTLAFPVPLPGGRRLVVSKCIEAFLRGSLACSGGLYLMDLATGAISRLSVDGARAWYLDGLLVVFTREGALVAVEFDPETGAVRGEPVALVGGLASSTTQRQEVAVSTGGTLAYLPLEGRIERTIVEVDRTGRERVVVAQPGPYLWVRLSPDETRLALVADAPGTAGGQLHLFDRRSGTMAQLTYAGANQRPSWSSDGQRIAFSSDRDSVVGVWVVSADGSAPATAIAPHRDVVQQTATSWTRDGRWIIIDGLADSGGSAGGDDIFALPASGEGSLQPVVATRAHEQAGEVSPDGRWIAYVSEDGGFPQVYVQPFLRPGGRTLVSVGTAIEPAWLSATELVYSSMTADSLMLARLTFGESVEVSRVALFDRSSYAAGTASWREYDVSRDGQRFIFARPTGGGGQPDLIVVVNWLHEIRAALADRRAAP